MGNIKRLILEKWPRLTEDARLQYNNSNSQHLRDNFSPGMKFIHRSINNSVCTYSYVHNLGGTFLVFPMYKVGFSLDYLCFYCNQGQMFTDYKCKYCIGTE